MKKIITILLWVLFYLPGASQIPGLDSLKNVFAGSSADSNKAKAAGELGNAFFSINMDSAIYYSELSVKWAHSSKDNRIQYLSLLALGNALSERDIPKSMQVYFEALQLAEKNNDQNTIALCYRSIGLLHLYLGNDALYTDFLKKAVLVYQELNQPQALSQSYAEIGANYIEYNSDSARYYLNLAARDSSQQTSSYFNYYWGRLESNVDPPKALAFFQKSLLLSSNKHNLRAVSLASRWLSLFYQKQGQLDSGITAAKSGLDAAQQLNFLRGVINNSEQLASIYKKKGQIDSAYKYQSIMVEAKDKLLSQDKVNKIQNAIIAEQQRVLRLQTEKDSLQDRIKLYSSIAIGFIILLFALFFYSNQRKIQRSNNILKSQRDEINKKRTELERSLDTLKSTQAQLIQSEKMASLGELTAGIAHEIQNPLNFVNNFSEVNKELLSEMNDEIDKGNLNEVKAIAKDVTENEEKINHHGKRAEAIVKGMLQHSRSSSGQKEPTDINALCDEYLRLSYHGLRAKDKSFNAKLKTDYDETIGNINIIPQDIGRVILNLLTNAFYSVSEKKKQQLQTRLPDEQDYEPTVTVSTKKISDKVEIRIKDNGNGIPQKVLDKIFQPFFTTKPTGQGTGLGLSLSYDIITKGHGGELKIQTKEGEFAEFIITL